MNLGKKLLILVIAGALFSGGYLWWKSKNIINLNQQEESGQYNFVYTDVEQAETLKWKNLSMDDLVRDALHGDRVALYNMGMYSLMGVAGLSIDVGFANLCFSKSASLGYAPALNQMAKKYAIDDSNMFLALVYVNLTIACGHHELMRFYHNSRDQLVQKFGQPVATKMEELAQQKMSEILTHQIDLEKATDKVDFCFKMGDIAIVDAALYGNDYWQKLCHKNKHP